MSKPKRYDSAYPGSMFEKPEGGFVEFNDVDSLAYALVKNYDAMRLSVDDWTDTAIANEKRAQIAERQRDELLAASKSMLHIFDRGLPESSIGRNVCDEMKAAVAKAEA